MDRQDPTIKKLESNSNSIKPSISRASIHTASPSINGLEAEGQGDIFQAKTQEEIRQNYHKILLTYGKWNAETYLKIVKDLNIEEGGTIEPLDICPLPGLGEKRNKGMKQGGNFLRTKALTTEFQKIRQECILNKSQVALPQYVPSEELETTREPTYKKIFRNAKANRKPRWDDSLGDLFIVPSSRRVEKQIVVTEHTDDESTENPKPCELERDAPNNYLLDLRKSKSEKDRKKLSFSSPSEIQMDDVERYYQNKPIQFVLENNLEDQIELMRASLKTQNHVTDVSGIDLLREKGYDELRAVCLNDSTSIEQFQNMFNDDRWRKKFELERIEDSDNADSLDVSDIATSETSSICSGDSLGTELDYKTKKVTPSRIPCIAEVREMSDTLFDKISLKWEKLIKKNFVDAQMKPCYTQFCSAIRLRSAEPTYSGIIKLLEPYDDFHAKKFTPHKHRLKHRMEKIGEMQKAKEYLVRERRKFESRLLKRGVGMTRVSVSPECVVDTQEPQYRGKNQRHRLLRIIRETSLRDEEGVADLTREGLWRDYANLRPMIQTKRKNKQPTESFMLRLHSEPRTRSSQKITHLSSLRNYETSLFLHFPPRISSKEGSSSSMNKSKLISNSRSKMRMPI